MAVTHPGSVPLDELGNHVASGGGNPRVDVGTNLARAEMRIMLEEIVGRPGDLERQGPPQRLRSIAINAIKHRPVQGEIS